MTPNHPHGASSFGSQFPNALVETEPLRLCFHESRARPCGFKAEAAPREKERRSNMNKEEEERRVVHG